MRLRIFCWAVLLLASKQNVMRAGASSSSGMVLRIRLADGSMEKVMVPKGAEESMTLSEILGPFSVGDDSTVQVGQSTVEDKASLLSSLEVKHGSIITVKPPANEGGAPTESRFSKLRVDQEQRSWDPFPDLAKDYEHALLKTKTRRSSGKGMSYADISRLQSSLHVVEAQPEGPIKRVYMCQYAAERFQGNGLVKKKDGGGVLSRAGLLLGTIQKERVDKTPRKARTSLSSQTSDSDFCTVAKVQAVWEPSGQKNRDVYDSSVATSLMHQNPRVLAIADHLGLMPVGWIFSHPDQRHEDEDALPVFGLDVWVGASLQIANMKERDRIEGKKFVTLAMDANTGATEAFQLSDVSVQMVHEGMFTFASDKQTSESPKGKKQKAKAITGASQRKVTTKHAVLVDGKESSELDSVLCLVNTAMLSHIGSYSGKSAVSSVKKNGGLTNKSKKTLLGLLEKDDRELLQELCDFNTLLALDQSLSQEDSEELCKCVKKWARGQKQGTALDSKLKLKLRGILDS